jgi:DNA invertase Pin-like site-specific DNA recombinase
MVENVENTKKYVAYYRVSTKKQGLGIDVQKEIVKNFVKSDILIDEFQEKESGKNNERIELNNAINACIKNKAILIVAKLDRLSRDAAFIFNLKNTLEQNKIEFISCDIPSMNTLMLGMYATFAQYERELISQRTRDALQELKRKGKKLGNPRSFDDKARIKAGKTKSKNAKKATKESWLIISSLLKENKSYSQIAKILNERGLTNNRNNPFSKSSIQQIIKLWKY